MNCPKCNEEIPEGNAFCGKCGKKISMNNGLKKYLIITSCIVIVAAVLITAFIIINNDKPVADTSNTTSIAKTGEVNKSSTLKSNTADVLTDQEEFAVRGIKAIRNMLKNPESLQIHYLSYWKGDNYIPHLQIEISAQNGFGGMNREFYAVSTIKEEAVLGQWDSENEVAVYKSTVQRKLLSGTELDIKKIMSFVDKQ